MLCYVIVSLSSSVITSLGEEGTGLSSTVITSLGEEGIGYFALLCYC